MKDESATLHDVMALHQQGLGQRRIAKQLGISRKRVRSLLQRLEQQREQGHSALPQRRKRKKSILDEHDSYMRALIDKYPDITAVRMQEELVAKGYAGGYSLVKTRLRQLRPLPEIKIVERFETEPGQQGQQDWSPYRLTFLERAPEKCKCFSFVLGFSRRQYIHFCEQEDLLTLCRQHEAAAKRFGGFPRSILYDNQKAVTTHREAGRPVYNPKFLAFAAHYGFIPVALPPRSPELKGKVERPFQYIEGNLLNARTFRSRADLNEQAHRWMDEISDQHLHDTTKERPVERFEREKEHLIALPNHPFDTAEVGYRVVSDEAMVHWQDVRYSVPGSAILDLVVVRATENEIIVYKHDLSEIARHERAPRGHRAPVINPMHRPSRKPRYDTEALVARMTEMGQDAAIFAAGIVRTQRCGGAQLAEVLGLVERYNADDVLAAMVRANRYRAFDASVVTRILLSTAEPRALPSTEEAQIARRLQEQQELLRVQPRDWSEYSKIFEPEPEEQS